MEFWEKVSRQRVHYIIDSYELYGDVPEDFHEYLEDLMVAYAPPQIELAIVETIVESWLQLPIIKGMKFLEHAHTHLQNWEKTSQSSAKITSAQFQQITGLDPTPVFGCCPVQIWGQ